MTTVGSPPSNFRTITATHRPDMEKTFKKGELLSRAILIATNGHHGQFDKAGNPYILHPLKVMALLESTDEELQAIAVLHDVVEDSKDVTFRDLEEQGMTPRVVEAVRLLTKQKGQTKQEYKDGVFSSKDAMRVKLADLTHNSDIRRLKGITQKDIDRMTAYQIFFMEIHQRLKD